MKRALLLAFGIPLLLVLALVAVVFLGLPSKGRVAALRTTNPSRTAVMLQRESEAGARKTPTGHLQTWVPLPHISRFLIEAVIASEDPKFFGHRGIDWEALKESAETDLSKGNYVRGGSTITQQLAKNLFFSTHKSLARKIREMVVSRWLEKDLSKGRILELYLNVIEWGDGVWGCEAASEHYFGKPSSELSETEAAGLAAMIPSPLRINPLRNPARYALAQKRVLALMALNGFLKGSVNRLGTLPTPVDEDESP